MTKEERVEYNRKYRAANKEKIAAGKKAWSEKNKEKEAAQKNAWYLANREKTIARTRAWLADKKHEPVVYYLPEHHYVGITDCLYNRLIHHRSFHKRLTEGYEIIYTAKDMTEARAVERYMHHEMGYNGKKGGIKGY